MRKGSMARGFMLDQVRPLQPMTSMRPARTVVMRSHHSRDQTDWAKWMTRSGYERGDRGTRRWGRTCGYGEKNDEEDTNPFCGDVAVWADAVVPGG